MQNYTLTLRESEENIEKVISVMDSAISILFAQANEGRYSCTIGEGEIEFSQQVKVPPQVDIHQAAASIRRNLPYTVELDKNDEKDPTITLTPLGGV